MGVPRLLKLRMASHSCSRPAVAPAARPLSSFLLVPTPAALPRAVPLSCAARACQGRAAPQPARLRIEAGRRFPHVAAMSSSTPPGPVQKSEEEWEAILTPEQFRILRLKGTEYPGTGEYDKLFDEGIYKCAGCGTPLYKSSAKFNSGCGWPAFYEGFPGAIKRTPDPDGRRTQITCAACGGHLGHVFKGFPVAVGLDEAVLKRNNGITPIRPLTGIEGNKQLAYKKSRARNVPGGRDRLQRTHSAALRSHPPLLRLIDVEGAGAEVAAHHWCSSQGRPFPSTPRIPTPRLSQTVAAGFRDCESRRCCGAAVLSCATC